MHNNMARSVESCRQRRGVHTLVLLDLSAAFDTVDNNILLESFKYLRCGSASTSLLIPGLHYILMAVMQFVCDSNERYNPLTTANGVPQRSVFDAVEYKAYGRYPG